MTNTHRKTTTNRTAARIAAVSAFGIGAAIAVPGLAAAQDAPAESPTASLENLGGEEGSLSDLTGEDGSLEGALGGALDVDLGSLALNLNLDAETPNPGSVELGSLGVSPNTGSGLVDGDSGSGSAEDDGAAEGSGSLDTGSLTGGSEDTETGAAEGTADEAPAEGTGSLGSAEAPAEDDATAPAEDDAAETGSLSDSLAGLSSGAEDGDDADTGVVTDVATGDEAAAGTGSLG